MWEKYMDVGRQRQPNLIDPYLLLSTMCYLQGLTSSLPTRLTQPVLCWLDPAASWHCLKNQTWRASFTPKARIVWKWGFVVERLRCLYLRHIRHRIKSCLSRLGRVSTSAWEFWQYTQLGGPFPLILKSNLFLQLFSSQEWADFTTTQVCKKAE